MIKRLNTITNSVNLIFPILGQKAAVYLVKPLFFIKLKNGLPATNFA